MFHQVSLEDSDIVHGKDQYEAQAADGGVRVMKYVWDDGVCKSKEFRETLTVRQQAMSYSCVDVHKQSGVAERGIPTVFNSARTMVLYQVLLWPEHFDMRLWPFALTHTAYL